MFHQKKFFSHDQEGDIAEHTQADQQNRVPTTCITDTFAIALKTKIFGLMPFMTPTMSLLNLSSTVEEHGDSVVMLTINTIIRYR